MSMVDGTWHVGGISRAAHGPQAAGGDHELDPAPEQLFTDHLSWDKETTHTNDIGSFLPIAALRAFAESGRVGSLAARFHGVPTDYSQRRNIEVDAPEILRRCREDEVDVALLVPL